MTGSDSFATSEPYTGGMNEPKTTSGHTWLILSFSLPCLVVGLASAGLCIWDMWGQDPKEIVIGTAQSFFGFGIPSGLAGIPIGYMLKEARSRGWWG
jgi:hypothetical protein